MLTKQFPEMEKYMITVRINSVKNFMNHLLNANTFDQFLMEEATIKTYNTFIIDGHIQTDFYSKEEQEDFNLCPFPFSSWSDMKRICFDLIKGKRLPLKMKFILQLHPDEKEALLQDLSLPYDSTQISALILKIQYENSSLNLTTGINYKTFVMNKQADQVWDKYLETFLNKHLIEYEHDN